MTADFGTFVFKNPAKYKICPDINYTLITKTVTRTFPSSKWSVPGSTLKKYHKIRDQ